MAQKSLWGLFRENTGHLVPIGLNGLKGTKEVSKGQKCLTLGHHICNGLGEVCLLTLGVAVG